MVFNLPIHEKSGVMVEWFYHNAEGSAITICAATNKNVLKTKSTVTEEMAMLCVVNL